MLVYSYNIFLQHDYARVFEYIFYVHIKIPKKRLIYQNLYYLYFKKKIYFILDSYICGYQN